MNQDAFNVTQWLEQGVFKALEDQYLEQLTFASFVAPVTGEPADRDLRFQVHLPNSLPMER